MLKTIILLTVFISIPSMASLSLRRCVILPITDGIKGAVSGVVYQEVENYLKSSSWCYYRSNSGLIDILSRYQHKLKVYLKDPKVLNVIANKTSAGSLISVDIESSSRGIELELFIFGENGVDVYYHEKSVFPKVDTAQIAQTIINWLEEYNKTIPYDVKITGIVGDSFTIDMGSSSGLNSGDEIEFVRPTKKKRHPLFKEIVDWETKSIARGKLFHTTEIQGQGKILKYNSFKEQLKVDDWGIIKKTTSLDINYKSEKERGDHFQFGKLGELSFDLSLNNFSVSINDSSGSKRQKGLLIGGKIDTEIWITREYWVGMHLNFTTGSVSKDTGSFSINNNSLYTAKYRLKFGYKYLLLGFFYGPTIDFILGYEQDNIALDNNVVDGIVGVTYSGLVFGTRATIPVYKRLKIFIHLDLVKFMSFKEDVLTLGEPDGVSSYQLKFGAIYAYKPNLSITGGLDLKSSKASYDATNKNITHKRISIVSGLRFTF